MTLKRSKLMTLKKTLKT